MTRPLQPATTHSATTASLLSRVRWSRVSRLAQREVRNREVHASVVSAYRWWARRPHSVMGAILDAAIDRYGEKLTVADPFSGGGTVTFESAKRGLRAYAQDLYPWPTRGLASALQPCAPEDLSEAAARVLSDLAPLRALYRTSTGTELSHILRVRLAKCRTCSTHLFQFPHPMISLVSRSAQERFAFFGCYACGAATKRSRSVKTFRCDQCERRWNAIEPHTSCVACGHGELEATGWRAVLVQELVQDNGRLKGTLRPTGHGDPVRAQRASTGIPALTSAIRPGKETKRLLDNGFTTWGDLYTQRQADLLAKALTAIKQLEAPVAVRDRLAFAVLGAAEMPAFLSRWDRLHLKCFEGMANHRYTRTTLAVETNLLSPIGRGTLPRRLEAATTTLQWLIESCPSFPRVVSTTAGRRGRKRTQWDVLIVNGSSTKQSLRNNSVSVVVTDPPYADDVQYGELARLFHTWLSVYDASVSVDEQLEAVPNSVRGTSFTDYENTIAACLSESRRTLKNNGTLILTFHNKKLKAWNALTGAIYKSGFYVKAIAVVRAENSADHCKRNVKAMLHDLVLECARATRRRPQAATLEFEPRTRAEFNLAAIGLALAECAALRSGKRLTTLYRQHLSQWTASTPLVE